MTDVWCLARSEKSLFSSKIHREERKTKSIRAWLWAWLASGVAYTSHSQSRGPRVLSSSPQIFEELREIMLTVYLECWRTLFMNRVCDVWLWYFSTVKFNTQAQWYTSQFSIKKSKLTRWLSRDREEVSCNTTFELLQISEVSGHWLSRAAVNSVFCEWMVYS